VLPRPFSLRFMLFAVELDYAARALLLAPGYPRLTIMSNSLAAHGRGYAISVSGMNPVKGMSSSRVPRARRAGSRLAPPFGAVFSSFARLQSSSFRLPSRPAARAQARCQRTRVQTGRLPAAPITNDHPPGMWEWTRPHNGRLQMAGSA
jgi:hypothetical protein